MVTAGIKNISTQGAMAKKGSNDAMPLSKMFQPPGNNHKNKDENNRKTATTVYPSKAEKALDFFEDEGSHESKAKDSPSGPLNHLVRPHLWLRSKQRFL